MRKPHSSGPRGPVSFLLLAGTGLLLLASTEGGTAYGAWSGESQDEQISFDNNEYARGVQVLFDEHNGGVHAFWMEDSPSTREVLYARSVDGGATWSSSTGDRIISLPDGNAAYEEPAVAAGEQLLIVVWSEDLVGTREVHYGISTDEGVTFSSETSESVLSDPNTAVDTLVPSVIVDTQGTIHVVWNQSVGETSEICYSRSTDMGATWSGTSGDRVISFPDGNGAADPKIMLGEDNRLVVIWKENSDLGGRVLQAGISDDGGSTWSSETADREISQPVNLMTNIDASSAISGGRELHAVYAGSFDVSSPFHYETYVTSSFDNGDTWSGESITTPVSFDEDHSRSTSNPDVFLSDCGGALVAWDESADPFGTNEIHISQLSGGIWSGATQDNVISFPDGENGYRPSVGGVSDPVILPSGRGGESADTWILWTEFEGGATDNYEVHLSSDVRCGSSSVPGADPTSPLSLLVRPNPAEGPLRIQMSLQNDEGLAPAESYGELAIFDAGGRQVLSRGVSLTDGRATFVWDPTSEDLTVPAGVYFVRARSGSWTQMRTVVLR